MHYSFTVKCCYITERKTKYAKGIVSKISLHTKFEVCLYLLQSYTVHPKV